MLILSRRETQKVLFPGLGISVAVISVKGKTVRLGIDAPNEIHVLRDELDEVSVPTSRIQPSAINSAPKNHAAADHESHGHESSRQMGQPQSRLAGSVPQRESCRDYRKIQQCLDAANLAIHLAQNQLRQQLSNNAEIALENALDCLDRLEQAVAAQATSLERAHDGAATKRPVATHGSRVLTFNDSAKTDADFNSDTGVVRETTPGYQAAISSSRWSEFQVLESVS